MVIDETALAKRKCNSGHLQAHQTMWILGIYDVGKMQGQLIWMDNRSHQATIPEVVKNVAEVSDTITDAVWPISFLLMG